MFMEGDGAQKRQIQVEAKPGIQEVEAWIKGTGTFQAGKKDGSIIEVSGRSTLVEASAPPTVDEVVAARNCTVEEAQKIVDLETVKFNQGEYPYPPKVAAVPEPIVQSVAAPAKLQPPTIEALMAAGHSKAAAQRVVNAENAKYAAGEFPYGDKLPGPKTRSTGITEEAGDESDTGAADGIDESQR
jgi:hypothetical protein